MTEVVIVDVLRTPFGRFVGGLASLEASALGGVVLKEIALRHSLDPHRIDQVIMGTVLAAGQGQVPSRRATLAAGFPATLPSFTVNKVCASSLKAVNLAAMAIRCGDAGVVIAGGMESMSRAPFLLRSHRDGKRLGNDTIEDSIMADGLCCPIDGVHMGVHGGDVAKEMSVSREEQDAWALRSQERYEAARSRGDIAQEIVAVETSKGTVVADEQPRPQTTKNALAGLRPAFSPEGTITAGNSPGINDGAACVLLASREAAMELGLPILARWVASGESAQEHPYLSTVPALAAQHAFTRVPGGCDASQMAVVEINEAFAAVAITSTRMMAVDEEIVNPNGGAVAVGHPIGASGARLVGAVVRELHRRGGGMGVATMCSGLAQGEATILAVDEG